MAGPCAQAQSSAASNGADLFHHIEPQVSPARVGAQCAPRSTHVNVNLNVNVNDKQGGP